MYFMCRINDGCCLYSSGWMCWSYRQRESGWPPGSCWVWVGHWCHWVQVVLGTHDTPPPRPLPPSPPTQSCTWLTLDTTDDTHLTHRQNTRKSCPLPLLTIQYTLLTLSLLIPSVIFILSTPMYPDTSSGLDCDIELCLMYCTFRWCKDKKRRLCLVRRTL